MKPKRLSLFFFLFAPFIQSLHGQSQSGFSNHYQLKFSPLRAVDFVNPGLELTLERNLGTRHSAQLSYARMTDAVSLQRSNKGYTGNRFALEWKRFTKSRHSTRNYVSVETVYSSVNHPFVNQFGPREMDTAAQRPFYTDSVHLYRKTLSLNFRIGHQFFFWKRFVFDAGIGIGVKYRNVRHTGRLIPGDELLPPRHPNAYHMAQNAGKEVVANLPCTLKIGYLF